MYQHLFYDYHLVYILATVLGTSTSISNSAVFLHTVLDPLKQSRLDFSNAKQTFVRIQLFEIDCGGLSFQIKFVPNASKHFGTLFPYYWKHQKCKCNIVDLKDSFIVNSFIFLFIHNMALLQGLVATTTGVGDENL